VDFINGKFGVQERLGFQQAIVDIFSSKKKSQNKSKLRILTCMYWDVLSHASIDLLTTKGEKTSQTWMPNTQMTVWPTQSEILTSNNANTAHEKGDVTKNNGNNTVTATQNGYFDPWTHTTLEDIKDKCRMALVDRPCSMRTTPKPWA